MIEAAPDKQKLLEINDYQFTPLQLAAALYKAEVVRAMLEAAPNPQALLEAKGLTPP